MYADQFLYVRQITEGNLMTYAVTQKSIADESYLQKMVEDFCLFMAMEVVKL